MSEWKLRSYEYYAKKYGESGDKSVIREWDKQQAKKYGAGSSRNVARISAEDIRRMADRGAGLKNIVSAYDSGDFDRFRHGTGTKRMVDAFRGSLGDGGGKGDGEGGGKRTTGIEDKGLTDYGEFGSMTPAAFDLYKEIKLRKLDGKNARQLQGIINSGKIEVAAIQRDASIYGSLVSGFW